MPSCGTKFHGQIEFSPEQVLRIPGGLFGFPREREWLLLEIPSLRPLVFLQSVKTENLCFLALPAQVVEPGYSLALENEDLTALGYLPGRPPVLGRDVLCLALLTVVEGRETTANLQTPVVVNIAEHRGRQVLIKGSYSLQQLIQPEFANAC